MNFQWYPGHMNKAKRIMLEDIKLIDIVIELLDARIPMSSKNPDIDTIGKQKPRLIVLNKVDLADDRVTEEWVRFYQSKGFYVVKINSKTGSGIKQINTVVLEACKEKIERDRKRGILARPIRAMVVGIPNVGKSTFINSIAGKASAKTGNKPGVTKGKQWIRLNKNVELMDTPGLLWPKFEDQLVGLRLAFIGSIKDDLLNMTEVCLELIKYLLVEYKGLLNKRYNAEEVENSVQVLENIAEKRFFRKTGNELDIDKAAVMILDEYRNGKIGKVSLEKVNYLGE
ncbi:MAG: ylqF [Clostridiales bacterium]|jgi:ribosome biogenesis GTPase A|nr:ylqF [Clostridiales bacterium]